MALTPGTRLGHYEIERVLGAGGMGVVYRAFDSRLQRPVAIKFIQQGDARDASHRLLAEARSASALNHPNICTIHEVADLGDEHFIVMEFVDGRAVSELLEQGVPPSDVALDIAIQVAGALAHAHERGVVHGDLKTANVMVADRGRAKVVDFGLARRQAADDATTEDLVQGTPYAMAPEQIAGAPGDTRVDVWAFGVFLQELLSGTRPYSGATAAAVVAAILTSQPAAPPDTLSSDVRDVIGRCLARDPGQRFQHAGELLEALERMAGSQAVTIDVERPPADPRIAMPPALAAAGSSRIVLIGRTDEWNCLQSAWDRAKAGRRQLVLLAGEAGIGKTRLTTEFARRAGEEATVLLGRCDQDALVPQQPFVEAFDWYARECAPSILQGQLSGIEGFAELAALVPALKRAGQRSDGLESSPEGRRYRLFEAVAAFVSRIARTRPLLLLLEDLHWADRPTALLLRHLLRSSHEAPLLIVGTYRETDVERGSPFAEVLADLRREEGVTRLALEGLRPERVREFIDQWTGRESPATFTDLVAGSTEGNPFFLGEVMRHLSETGVLDRMDAASDATTLLDLGGLPDGVRDTIERRLARLDDECARVLGLASILGREFTLPALAALAARSEDQILDRLDEAVAANLVHDVPRAPDRYTFTHALVRDALYDRLTPTRRSRLHRQAAEVIDRLAGSGSRPLADLAHHYAQAGTPADAEKAIACALGAAEQAETAFAFEEAARFYGVALGALDRLPHDAANDRRRLDLHLRRGRAYTGLGLWTLGRTEFEMALPLVPSDDRAARAQVLIDLSRCCFWAFDLAALGRYAPEAQALAEGLDRPYLAAEAMSWLAGKLNADGDVPQAVELDRRALALAGGPKTFAFARTAMSLYHVGSIAEAVERGIEAVNAARAAGDPHFLTCTLQQHGLCLTSSGRYAEARQAFDEMREVGRRHGVLPMLARGIAMNAGLHVSLGDYVQAEQLAHEARELAQRIGFLPAFVSAGLDLVTIHARAQDPGRADALIDDVATSVAAGSGWHGWLWRLRLSQARAEWHAARGEWAASIDAATACIADSRARTRPKYVALGLLSRARARHVMGDRNAARTDLVEGLEVARGLGDPSIVLSALRLHLEIDGSDALLAEAMRVQDGILSQIDDAVLRARFLERAAVLR